MLDPFRPEQPEDVARLDTLLKEMHLIFSDLVKTRRGSTLAAAEAALFSGEFWLGSQALGLGLVDGLGDLRTVLKARYGSEVQTPLMERPGPFFLRRAGGVSAGLLAGTAVALVAVVIAAIPVRKKIV